MVKQFYAVHKETGEIFEHKGRYCFSEVGIKQSLRNDRGSWSWVTGSRSKLVIDPLPKWEIKEVELL